MRLSTPIPFFCKKLCLYVCVASLATCMIYKFELLLAALPSILISSVLLSFRDTRYEHADLQKTVFTFKTDMFLMALILLVIGIQLGLFHFNATGIWELFQSMLKYIVIKFLLYTTIGLVAANCPFFFFGMIFGSPAVILTAILLTCRDVFETEADYMKEVFSKNTISTILYTILFAIGITLSFVLIVGLILS